MVFPKAVFQRQLAATAVYQHSFLVSRFALLPFHSPRFVQSPSVSDSRDGWGVLQVSSFLKMKDNTLAVQASIISDRSSRLSLSDQSSALLSTPLHSNPIPEKGIVRPWTKFHRNRRKMKNEAPLLRKSSLSREITTYSTTPCKTLFYSEPIRFTELKVKVSHLSNPNTRGHDNMWLSCKRQASALARLSSTVLHTNSDSSFP